MGTNQRAAHASTSQCRLYCASTEQTSWRTMKMSAFPAASCVLWLLHLTTCSSLSDTPSQWMTTVCPSVNPPFFCTCVNSSRPPDLVCSIQYESRPWFNPATPTTLLKTNHHSANFSVQMLDLSGINLSNIGDSFLQGIGSVHFLRAQYCGLTTLPQAFRQLSGLHMLDMSNNQMASFSMDSIANLSVHRLRLASNNLWQIRVEEELPSRLAVLDVHQNNLMQLPTQLWEGLSEIYLSNNVLTQLPAVKYSMLRVLDVSHNQLTQFPANFVTATPLLRSLSIACNHVHQWGILPDGLELSNLENLDLSNNHLQNLSDRILSHMPHLSNLDLSHNRLTHLSESHFSSLCTSLDSLNLSHNALAVLHPATFSHLQHLQLLNLSHNSLLGKTGFIHLGLPEHLVSLDLQYCSLRHVDFCQLSMHDLKHLYLEHNPLQCSCHLYFLYQRHRNELENKTAQPTASRTWQCVSSKTGELISVTMQQSCSTSGVQCLTNAPSLPPASDVKVTVNVVLAEHNLITSWHLPDGLHHIQGFRVLCLHPRETDSSNNAEHISPFLGSQLRSYTLTDVDDDTQYKVCVDVMHNQTHIFKRVCKLMQEKETNVLVGILAGSIFLIPCFMFVIYIIVKDRRINSGLNQDDDTDSHNCQSLSASAALCQGSAMEETADCPFLQNDSSTIVVPMLKQSNVHQPAQAV